MDDDISWDLAHAVGGPVDQIFAGLRELFADLQVRRLTVTHAADDDNVWYIRRTMNPDEVQLDSMPGGAPPFLLESDTATARTDQVAEAIDVVGNWLRSGA
jgi:hypothetical protein